jgi:hypothetical protein
MDARRARERHGAAGRATAFVLQVAPSGVAFDSEDPFADLIIETDLAAEHGGIAGFRE